MKQRPMRRLLVFEIALVAAIVAGAYLLIAQPWADRGELVASEGPRTQLVTEDYLRRQLDIKTAHLWGRVVAELLTGNLATDDFGESYRGTPAAPRVTGVWADTDWPNNRRVYVEFELTGRPYAHNWYRLELDFARPRLQHRRRLGHAGRVPPAAGRRRRHDRGVHDRREPARLPHRAPDLQDGDRDLGFVHQPHRVPRAIQRRHGRGRHGRGEGLGHLRG